MLAIGMAIVVGVPEPHYCHPKDSTARVLTKPSPNAIHPDWSDESTLGGAWTFVPLQPEEDHFDQLYQYGNLLSPRGGVVNKGIYILVKEWDCY